MAKRLIFTLITCISTISCSSQSKVKTTQGNDDTVTRPNIIWLMAEDISSDLECYGMANVKTPFLNKMAQEAMQAIQRYLAIIPCCIKGERSMLILSMNLLGRGMAKSNLDFLTSMTILKRQTSPSLPKFS